MLFVLKEGPPKYKGTEGEEVAAKGASKHSCPLHSTFKSEVSCNNHITCVKSLGAWIACLPASLSPFLPSFFLSFCPSFLSSFPHSFASFLLFLPLLGLNHQAGALPLNCIVSRSLFTLFFFFNLRQILTNLPRLTLMFCSSGRPFELVVFLPQCRM